MSFFPFLQLPRELRDSIYTYYFGDEGYEYCFPSNTLRHRTGETIDIALAYACPQISYEMAGLALSINTIKFSTFSSEITHEQAALFDAAFEKEKSAQWDLVRRFAPKLFTDEMVQTAAKEYPIFTPLIHAWSQHEDPFITEHREHQPSFPWGEALSIWNSFGEFILRLLSRHPSCRDTVGGGPLSLFKTTWFPDKPNFVIGTVVPWSIPQVQELNWLLHVHDMHTIYQTHDMYSAYETSFHPEKCRFAYSAAAAFIRFHRSLSVKARSSLRDVVLHEDRRSVAQPECHGRGLIPICQENPRLRVVRKVSILEHVSVLSRGIPALDVSVDRGVAQSLGPWIVGCYMLPSLGMPSNSYTLIFDGDSNPQESSALFEAMHRAVAEHTALDTCYALGHFTQPSWTERRSRRVYSLEMLPDALEELTQGTSFMKCNFDPGKMHDPNALVTARKYWSLQKWEDR